MDTRASKALEFVAGMSLILGMPTAILLTVFLDLWWLFIPVVAVVIIAGGLSQAAKEPRPGT